MSFVSKAIGSVAKALGLVPEAPSAPAAAPAAPTVDNSYAAMDAAAQTQAAAMTRGRTSTLLTGGAGETDDLTKTSKVLLGQ